jgi:O-antigen/teichoic acid export membrane protein
MLNFFERLSPEIRNIMWLFSEKIVTMFMVLIVSILIARSVGPDLFGQLSYLLAFVSIILVISPLGINSIFIKEIVTADKNSGIIIGTCLMIRFFGAAATLVVVLILTQYALLKAIDSFWLICAAITGFSAVLYLFDFWFQAKVKAKYSVVVRVVNILLFSIIKLWIVLTGGAFNYLLVVVIVEPIIISISYYVAYKVSISREKELVWKVDFSYALTLLNKSWWLIFSAIASVICLKIDQLMIAEIIGNKELGIYSVAVRLSEVWYFFPVAIASSYFPSLIKLKANNKEEYSKRLQWLCDWLFMAALLVSLVMTLISDYLIGFLYGEIYSEAASVLNIHMWAAIIVFMRALFSKWIINESAYKFSLITHGAAAVLNVALNLLFIPKFGAIGAAWATLFSYIIASYLILSLSKKTRPFFFFMSKSLFVPFTVMRLYRALLPNEK